MKNTTILFTLLLISALYQVLEAQDPCTGVNPAVIQCHQNYYFCSTFITCEVEYSQYWDAISVSPSVVAIDITYGLYKVFINESGSYTFATRLGSCFKTQTVDVRLPSYTFTQPKCSQDSYTVTVQLPYTIDSTYEFKINGVSFGNSSVMSTTYTRDVTTLSLSRVVDTDLETCDVNIHITPQHDLVPVIQMTPSTCAQANGELTVTNYNQFSRLILNMELGGNITAVNGVFSGIKVTNGNQERYTLYATSSLCDSTLVFQGTYFSRNPVIYVKEEPLSTTSCNKTHSYLTFQVTGITLTSTIITANNINYTIGDRYILPYDSYNISYNGDLCSVYREFTSRLEEVPVSYSVAPPMPTCASNSTITFVSPNNYYNSLQLSSNLYGNITMNANHQVQRGYGESIDVVGLCSDLSIPSLEPSGISPIITYDNTDCGGNMTVIIQNYQRYDLLQLTSSRQSYQATQGIFLNVWYDAYILSYREVGCSNIGTKDIGSLPSTNFEYNYLEYNISVVTPRIYCEDTTTILNVTPIYKGLVSTHVSTITITGSTGDAQSITFTHPKCPNAPLLTFPTTNYKQITPPKFTVSAPVCKSSYATVMIENVPAYTSVNVYPFGTIQKTVDNTYPLNVMNPIIQINFQDGCSANYTVSLNPIPIPINPDLEVPYTIIQQSTSDCQVPSGGVSINTMEYSTSITTINGVSQPSGIWEGFGSFSSVNMVYKHQMCGYGVTQIQVSTATTDLDIKPTIIEKSTCFQDSGRGASLYLNITTRESGAIFNYSNISCRFCRFNENTGILSSVSGGESVIVIKKGNHCLIQYPIQVPVRIPGHAFNATILDYPENDMQTGLVRIDPLYSNIQITEGTYTNYGVFSVDYKYIMGIPSIVSDMYIYIHYNSECYDTLYVNLTRPNNYQPEYIVKPGKQCGIDLATVEFSQESLNRFYIYLDQFGQVLNTNPINISSLLNYQFTYQDKYTFETDTNYIEIDNTFMYNIADPVIALYNETCNGSQDGFITISGIDFSSNLVSVVSHDYNNYNPLPFSMSSNSMVFGNLPTGNYELNIQSASNPFCIITKYLFVGNDEPTFDYDYTAICWTSSYSGDRTNGTFTVNVYPPTYQASFSIDGVLQKNTNVYSSQELNTHLVQINATKGQCTRTWSMELYLSPKEYGTFEASSMGCEQLSVAPYSSEKVNVYNPKGELVASGQDLYSYSFNLPGGVYKVAVQPNPNTCYQPITVYVADCRSGSSSEPSSSSILLPSLLFIISFILSILL